jgi:putative drug exporter of the RND superfamily
VKRAILRLLGRRAWWMPAWLDRVLPEVRLSHDLPEAVRPQPTREKRAAAATAAALPETPSFT